MAVNVSLITTPFYTGVADVVGGSLPAQIFSFLQGRELRELKNLVGRYAALDTSRLFGYPRTFFTGIAGVNILSLTRKNYATPNKVKSGIFLIDPLSNSGVYNYMKFQFNPEEISDEKSVEYSDRSKTGVNNADPIWVKGGPRKLSFKLFLDSTLGSVNPDSGNGVNKPSFRSVVGDITGLPLTPSKYKQELGDYGNGVKGGGSVTRHNPFKGTLEQVEFLQSLLYPHYQNVASTAKFSYGGFKQRKDRFTTPPQVYFIYGPMVHKGIVESVYVTHQLFDKNLIPQRTECNVVFRVIEGKTVKLSQVDIPGEMSNIKQASAI